MRGWRVKRGCILTLSIVFGLWSWDGATETFSGEQVQQGHRLYKQFCQRCHGPSLVAFNPSIYDLRKFPPNARERFVVAVVKGKSAMPAWGDVLSEEEVAALYAYIQSAK
jgi:mono/diheme cytochrome c family protein